MDIHDYIKLHLKEYVQNGYFSGSEDLHDSLQGFISTLIEEYEINDSEISVRKLADDYAQLLDWYLAMD